MHFMGLIIYINSHIFRRAYSFANANLSQKFLENNALNMCGNICGEEKCCSGVFLQPDVDISLLKKKLHNSWKGIFMKDFKMEWTFMVILYVPFS